MQDGGVKEPPLRLHGDADRHGRTDRDDDFAQADDLYRLMSKEQQSQLVANLVAPLKTVPRHIQLRQLGHCLRVDADYGAGVAAGLGIALLDEVPGRATRLSALESR